MGLSASPTVALGATDLLDPLTGKPLRPEDRYYGSISDELAEITAQLEAMSQAQLASKADDDRQSVTRALFLTLDGSAA